MKFELVVKQWFRSYQITAEIIETTPVSEKIKITGYWGRSITLQNNRPFFFSRGLRHRRWDWELIEGNVKSQSFLEVLLNELELKLRAL